MSAGSWIALATAIFGAVAVVIAARINGRATGASSLDAKAAKVLEEALDYQSKEIAGLRGRVEGLEAEVKACELGRERDRERHASELAELRRELGLT